MIRFQTRDQKYRLDTNHQHAAEENNTYFTFMVPLVEVQSTESRSLTGDSCQVRSVSATDQLVQHLGKNVPIQRHAVVMQDRDRSKLPLLCTVAGGSLLARGDDAAMEALISGGVTSTSGAILGFAAWLVGGPAGAALFWSLTGASIVGGTVGVAQYAHVAASTDARDFAEKCNLFLKKCNEDMLGPTARAMYDRCRQAADSQPKQELLRQLDQLLSAHYGDDAAFFGLRPPIARSAPAQPALQQPPAPQQTTTVAPQRHAEHRAPPAVHAFSHDSMSSSYPAAQFYMAGYGGR